MKKLLAITIVLTICLSVYAETAELENKGVLMQKSEEEYAEKMSLQMEEEKTKIQQELESLPQVARGAVPADFYVCWKYGDDANDGLSESYPWKTLDNVNKMTNVPGDRILFKGSDEWRGRIYKEFLTNVIFGAYGVENGEKPIINGAVEISEWQLYNPFGQATHIYWAVLPDEYTNSVEQLFVDGERQMFGRYPNESYFIIDDVDKYYDIFDKITTNIYEDELGNIITNIITETITNAFTKTIIDTELLIAPNNWSGGRVFIRHLSYAMISRNIVSSNLFDGTILPLDEEIPVPVSKAYNRGYYIENHIDTLDTKGEWYYDEASRAIYLYWPDGVRDLLERGIEASIFENCFLLNSVKNVTITDMAINNPANHGIHIANSEEVNIISNNISKTAGGGAYLVNVSNAKIKECQFNNTADFGIFGYGCLYAQIENNLVDTTGIDVSVEGQHRYGLWLLNYSGTHGEISGNTVLNSGYCGIRFDGSYTTVENNFVSNSCVVLDDGSGIYTYSRPSYSCENSTINSNIVISTFGNADGSPYPYPLVSGIYIDGRYAREFDITGNSIIFSGIAIKGIMKSANVCKNTLYQNVLSWLGWEYHTLFVEGTSNTTFCLNAVVDGPDNLVSVYTRREPSLDFIKCDSNIYCNIYEDAEIFFKTPSNFFTFQNWQLFYTQDLNSVSVGIMLRNVCDNVCESRILYNPTLENKTFDLKGMEYFDIEANEVMGSVTLAPFSSKVLFFKADKHFVSHEGGHISPFYYPEVAATNFQMAINAAGTDHTVLVAEGTYLPDQELNITSDIEVKSIAGAEMTIIDGDNSHRCVRLNNSGAVLDGFTLTKGSVDYGGGIYCSAGTVQNCIIKDNWSYHYGGGVYCENNGTLLNCLIKNNDSCMGGGVSYASGLIINSTIIDNFAIFGGGIYRCGSGSIVNSIIFNNNALFRGPNYYPSYAAQSLLFYCCTEPMPIGISCLTKNPQFADSAGRLSSDSPCVDAGGLMGLCDTDLDGFARIRGTGIDIGAYESAQTISDSINIPSYMVASIYWTGPEYIDVWRNTTGIYSDFSLTNSNWVLEAANVSSPYFFLVYDYIMTQYYTPIYIHLMHTDIAHPMYEDDLIITIEPWDSIYFYYW